MNDSPRHLLQENAALRQRIAALEGEIAALKGQKAGSGNILPRADFIREIARMVAHDERYGGTSSLLVISLEGLGALKPVQTSSYQKIMGAAGQCLARHVRACDVTGHTGDEDFSVLLTRCSVDDAEKKAEILAQKIKESLDPLLGADTTLTLRYAVSILNTRS